MVRRGVVVTVLLASGYAACSSEDPSPASPPAPDDADASGDAAPPPSPPPDASVEEDASPVVDAGGDDAAPGYEYVAYDINHILSTGQSNAVANGSSPLSESQPYGNLMFDTGVITAAECDGNLCTTYQTPTALVPLVEGDTFFNSTDRRETMSSGLANQISQLAEQVYFANTPNQRHDTLLSMHGRSGNRYYCLRFGGCTWYDSPSRPTLKPFAEGMLQVESAMQLASAAGKSYVVRAVTANHGESDHYATDAFPREGTDGTPNKITNYADALIEWQADYEREVRARTGQAEPVPLLVAQMHNWNDVRVSPITADQYNAHLRAPGKVVLVTPTYMLPFNGDCLHFTSTSQVRLGEYYAKAYAQLIFTGRPWEPLRPRSVQREGAVIRIDYAVPAPPLTLDTEAVLDPGSFGFDVVDGAGALSPIASVVVSAPTSVTVTLANAPVPGETYWLRYALNATPQTCVGPERGPRGNLRDSDATVSRSGASLHNWGVSFQIELP